MKDKLRSKFYFVFSNNFKFVFVFSNNFKFKFYFVFSNNYLHVIIISKYIKKCRRFFPIEVRWVHRFRNILIDQLNSCFK